MNNAKADIVIGNDIWGMGLILAQLFEIKYKFRTASGQLQMLTPLEAFTQHRKHLTNDRMIKSSVIAKLGNDWLEDGQNDPMHKLIRNTLKTKSKKRPSMDQVVTDLRKIL